MEGSAPCYHGTSLSRDDCIHSPHSHELVMNSMWLDEVHVRVENDVRPTVNLHASSQKGWPNDYMTFSLVFDV